MDLVDCINAYDSARTNPSADNTLKIGFVMGLIEGVQAAGQSRFFSTPDNWTVVQHIEILRKFLREHPDKLNEAESILVIRSFMEAYPLKQAGS